MLKSCTCNVYNRLKHIIDENIEKLRAQYKILIKKILSSDDIAIYVCSLVSIKHLTFNISNSISRKSISIQRKLCLGVSKASKRSINIVPMLRPFSNTFNTEY